MVETKEVSEKAPKKNYTFDDLKNDLLEVNQGLNSVIEKLIDALVEISNQKPVMK